MLAAYFPKGFKTLCLVRCPHLTLLSFASKQCPTAETLIAVQSPVLPPTYKMILTRGEESLGRIYCFGVVEGPGYFKGLGF